MTAVQNYARTIVAALRDFEVLLSCPLSVQGGLEIGGDHGLERGPAIEWGHDASIHGQAGITVSMAMLHEMSLESNRLDQETSINNVLLVAFFVWEPRMACPISSTLLRKCFA